MKRRKAMSLLSIGIITKQLPTQVVSSVLTEREREVLALVARGYTNKQIAEALYVTEKTARNHVSHILDKLELSRRSEAAAFAVEHRLVPPRMLQ
jgi:two-component system, NarL family, response regulator DevR